MKQYKLINNLLGWLTFAIAAFVFCSTIEPTASFWDCPEFITTGYKLEIGHPPGAPFFMLTANLFSQFASDPTTVAKMVNTMSALLSAACIMFLFWSITYLAKKLVCPDEESPCYMYTAASAAVYSGDPYDAYLFIDVRILSYFDLMNVFRVEYLYGNIGHNSLIGFYFDILYHSSIKHSVYIYCCELIIHMESYVIETVFFEYKSRYDVFGRVDLHIDLPVIEIDAEDNRFSDIKTNRRDIIDLSVFFNHLVDLNIVYIRNIRRLTAASGENACLISRDNIAFIAIGFATGYFCRA